MALQVTHLGRCMARFSQKEYLHPKTLSEVHAMPRDSHIWEGLRGLKMKKKILPTNLCDRRWLIH